MKNKGNRRAEQVRGPYCGAPATVRSASEIYGGSDSRGRLYVCSNYPRCNAYARMDPCTGRPMGELANGDLRHKRIVAHRRFDRLWQEGVMSRDAAYRWLADYFSIPLGDAHIARFSEYRCDELIRKCDQLLRIQQESAI